MALESGTYINSLNASNPASTDGLGQADDHLRLIKSTLKATFPNITGAVTATQADLNNIGSIPSTLTDLGISDGSNGQVLTTNGSGGFSFTTVSQGSSGIALSDLSVGSENAASGNGAISYNSSNGQFKYTPPTAAGIGALTAHPNISAATTSTNSGSTFIQSIGVDSNGHITSIGTATASVTVPNTAAAVGTYMLARWYGPGLSFGATKAGSSLQAASGYGGSGTNPNASWNGDWNYVAGSFQSGTWRHMGHAGLSNSSTVTRYGLFVKISA